MTKEETREYNRKYYAEHRDYYKQYHVGYYAEHGEEIREKKRERDSNNRETVNAKRMKYYYENQEQEREWRNAYKQTKHGRAIHYAASYRKADRNDGYGDNDTINAEWIENNIFNGQTCYYCGESDWTKLGADRIDNGKGHTPDNCICACWNCNRERKNKYSVEEFVAIKKKEKGGE